MITLHGREVKVGDKVWDVKKGWHSVTAIGGITALYPISLGDNAYTDTGRLYISDPNPTLFWEEMILTSKPKPVYEWQWLYSVGNAKHWEVSHGFYKTEEELREILIDNPDRIIVKIEPSKREVKL